MFDAKILADLITLTRGLLGVVMIVLGIVQGESSLPAVVLLMLLCWTGDFVDGSIAHLDPAQRRTWIGDSDIYVDLFVSLCLGATLVFAGYVSMPFAVCYLAGWLIAFLLFGLEHNLLMLIQAPSYLALILTALRVVPSAGIWLLIWIAAATIINRRRFSHKIVPEFLKGMGALFHRIGRPPRPS